MKVNELQQFLRSLVQPLTIAGGRKAADDLERAAAGMELFKEMSVPDFADFLTRAEHLVRTGELPQSGRSSKPRAPKAGSEQKVKDASQRLAALLERASDDDFNQAAVREEIQALDAMTIGELQQVAKELDITRKFRTKQDLLEELERKMTGGRATSARTPLDNDRPPSGDTRIQDRAEELADRLDGVGAGERDER